ncbi:MAG TPA: DUF5682 family protein [Planctomycetota bacterium]|jgi:hypothetical protein
MKKENENIGVNLSAAAVLSRLCDTRGRAVYFPVRHHSPAAARLVQQLILDMKPAAVLIEGPSDFNPQFQELYLGHTLPIAIYSFVRVNEDQRRGAYYPFCEYSPEWQALLAARKVKAHVEFIDLPWSELAAEEEVTNRYADAELRRSKYVATLCRELGVDDFDALWDELFEIERLTLPVYLQRCHSYCFHSRQLDGDAIPQSDLKREAFMAQQIRRVMDSCSGQVLIVTGGYHSSGLLELEQTPPHPGLASLARPSRGEGEAGIALTPYSYSRLDGLTGYNAGMPGPGFYHCVWNDRQSGGPFRHRKLLGEVVSALRKKEQIVSSADLIGVETTAQALAALRSHAEIWRRDLVDGLKSAVLKDEVALGCSHPLLDAILDVFRGDQRGRLAKGTSLPPLVADLKARLAEHKLEPQDARREIELDLDKPADAEKSRVLHQLRLLGIAGFNRTGGTDLHTREDLSSIVERWDVAWSPEFDSSTIEAARYGASLDTAAEAVLAERIKAIARDSGAAAGVLLDAALAGLAAHAHDVYSRLDALLRADSDFLNVVVALRHLLYLYKYDRVLKTAGLNQLESLIHRNWQRSLALFESLGQITGKDLPVLNAIKALVETYEVCGGIQSSGADVFDKNEMTDVFTRVSADKNQSPAIRGAATGALWVLGCADPQRVLSEMKLFADPARLGDYLSGVFCIAREPAQRHVGLLTAVDELLMGYNDDQYLIALPALRLAFTYFTPREKHHMALSLLSAAGDKPEEVEVTGAALSVAEAAAAIAFESRLAAALERYGLRGRESQGAPGALARGAAGEAPAAPSGALEARP